MKYIDGESPEAPRLEEVVAGTQTQETNKVQETHVKWMEELREPKGEGSFRGKKGNGIVPI